MGKPRPKATVEETIADVLQELRVYGVVAVKVIAQAKGMQSGTMACPLCQQELRFSIAPSNGHIWAKCSTPRCISAVE